MRRIPFSSLIVFVVLVIAVWWALVITSRHIEPMESGSSASSTSSALPSLGSSLSSSTSISSGSGTGGSSSATLEKGSGNSISQLCGGQCSTGQICVTQGTGAKMSYCCKTKPMTWRAFGELGSGSEQIACDPGETKKIVSAAAQSDLVGSAYSSAEAQESTYLSQFK